ncbi:hypothetical protein A0J61_01517 [Choanephora cucurbitarum]|uniref:Transcription factor CBF/NF-Y/archaeal histone domain-containing protein n=1 Tax=Choanephora cucurbitarum TaxID=101091 RepID=A0A1C7NN57_9FUNG|nr:hypothetical protein A0J61_01517 [Choanephora cucurbitarum]
MPKASKEPVKRSRTKFREDLRTKFGKSLSADVDDLLYLEFVMFMDHLAKNAAKHVGKRKILDPKDVEAVLETTLRRFRG